MFMTVGTLHIKITVDVSDHGYLTEEMLQDVSNSGLSKGHPVTVAGIGIITKSMGQIIWKSEDYCHISEVLLPLSSG
jgi:hypothetical protein